MSRPYVASVGSAFKSKRKAQRLLLPETAKKIRLFNRRPFIGKLLPDEEPSLEWSNFSLSFQVVKAFILYIFRSKIWIFRLEAQSYAKNSANWPRTPSAVRISILRYDYEAQDTCVC